MRDETNGRLSQRIRLFAVPRFYGGHCVTQASRLSTSNTATLPAAVRGRAGAVFKSGTGFTSPPEAPTGWQRRARATLAILMLEGARHLRWVNA